MFGTEIIVCHIDFSLDQCCNILGVGIVQNKPVSVSDHTGIACIILRISIIDVPADRRVRHRGQISAGAVESTVLRRCIRQVRYIIGLADGFHIIAQAGMIILMEHRALCRVVQPVVQGLSLTAHCAADRADVLRQDIREVVAQLLGGQFLLAQLAVPVGNGGVPGKVAIDVDIRRLIDELRPDRRSFPGQGVAHSGAVRSGLLRAHQLLGVTVKDVVAEHAPLLVVHFTQYGSL